MSMSGERPLSAGHTPDLHLLQACLSLGTDAPVRPSARERLEEAVGRELAHRLLRSLTASGYR
jgi:hypothetical protein